MSVRRLVVIAFTAAIQYICFSSFSFILYLEVITFITVSFAMVFPRYDAILASLIFTMVNLLTMGFTPWTFMYLLIYPVYSFITASLSGILYRRFCLLVILCGLFSFLTGQLVQIPFMLFSKHITVYYIISGLRVSVPQGFMAAALCYLLFRPLNHVLVKIKERMYNYEKTI